jgi:hypothetical protein
MVYSISEEERHKTNVQILTHNMIAYDNHLLAATPEVANFTY